MSHLLSRLAAGRLSMSCVTPLGKASWKLAPGVLRLHPTLLYPLLSWLYILSLQSIIAVSTTSSWVFWVLLVNHGNQAWSWEPLPQVYTKRINPLAFVAYGLTRSPEFYWTSKFWMLRTVCACDLEVPKPGRATQAYGEFCRPAPDSLNQKFGQWSGYLFLRKRDLLTCNFWTAELPELLAPAAANGHESHQLSFLSSSNPHTPSSLSCGLISPCCCSPQSRFSVPLFSI